MSIDPAQPIPIVLPAEDAAPRGDPERPVRRPATGCRPSTSSARATASAARRSTRALSELAAGGRDPAPPAPRHVRQPALAAQAGPTGPELRVVVPRGPLGADDPRRAGDRDASASSRSHGRRCTRRSRTRSRRAVAPDLAVLDSVWMPEFADRRLPPRARGRRRGVGARRCTTPTSSRRSSRRTATSGQDVTASPRSRDVAGLWYSRARARGARARAARGRGASCGRRRAPSAGRPDPPPDRHARRLASRRDHGLLPDRTSSPRNGVRVLGPEGVDRRDRAAAAGTLRFVRRLVVDGRDARRRRRATSGTAPIRLLADGRAAFSARRDATRRQALARGARRAAERALAEHVGFMEPCPAGREAAPRSRAAALDLHRSSVRLPSLRWRCGCWNEPSRRTRLHAWRQTTGRIPSRRSAVSARPPRSCRSSRRPPRSWNAPCPDRGCRRTRGSRCSFR